jgi:hypothetical protein
VRVTACRNAAALTCAAAAALAIAACSPAGKEAAVRKISAASRRPELRMGSLELSSAIVHISVPGGASGPSLPAGAGALAGLLPSPTGAAAGPPAAVTLVIDVGGRRAALLAPGAVAGKVGATTSTGGAPALVLFDGGVTYVRRPTQGIVGARPWYRLDTAFLTQISEPPTSAMALPRTISDLVVLSPIILLEQASGFLTGSLKDRGMQSLTPPGGGAAVPSSHYAGNTSLDKTTRSFRRDADQKRPVQRLLRVFAAHDDINPVEAWVSADGRLRRLDVGYRSRPDRGVLMSVRYRLALDPTDGLDAPKIPADVLNAPAAADTVTVTSLAQLRGALGQWFSTPAAPPAAGTS